MKPADNHGVLQSGSATRSRQLASQLPPPAKPCRYPRGISSLKPHFKIWHLLLLTLIAALVTASKVKRESFPYSTTEAASRRNAASMQGYEIVEYKGDMNGPYKSLWSAVEAVPVNRSAKTVGSQSVRYQIDGASKTYDIPNDDKMTTIVSVFENPKGNHLLVIFEKPWD